MLRLPIDYRRSLIAGTATSLATRSLICGPGYLDRDGKFLVSERSRKTTELARGVRVGDDPNRGRAVMDDRLDYFCGGRPRLQVVCGEAPSNQRTAAVQFGSTCLVLHALEKSLIKEASFKRFGDSESPCDSPPLSDSGRDRIMVPVGGPKDERVAAGSATSLAAV